MQANYLSDVANTVAATELKSYSIATQISAPGTLAETVVGAFSGAGGAALDRVIITPASALAASDTVFVTVTIAKRTAGGAAVPVIVGTSKTVPGGGTGSWVAWTPVQMPANAGAAVAAGDILTVTIAGTGGGQNVPPCTIEIFTKLS